jgi:hypothetical protein
MTLGVADHDHVWRIGELLQRRNVSFWHDSALSRWAEWGPLCPGSSDVNLLGNSQGVIDLYPKVSHGTLDPAMT